MVLDGKLLLHCGADYDDIELSDTWILDLPSQTWRQYVSDKDHPRSGHTSSRGLDNNVIIIGGVYDNPNIFNNNQLSKYKTVFYVIVEPKSLQQLTLQVICKHKSTLPWQGLPESLRLLLHMIIQEIESDGYDNEHR